MIKNSTTSFATLISGVLLACMTTSTLAAPFVIESPAERVALSQLRSAMNGGQCRPAGGRGFTA